MSILTKLKDIPGLPTLPEVMLKVQELIKSEKSDAATLAAIIKQDPAISSTILKIANSSFYNIANRRITAVAEAIARIGFNEVLRITMAMSVIKQFPKNGSMLGYKAFWLHSLTAANMTSSIVDMANTRSLEQYRQDLFLAGLLHDIGILVYDQFFHEEFSRIMNFALREEKTFLTAENVTSAKENHAFIGGALLEIWKLSLPVIVAVRDHHMPEKAPEKLIGMVAVISLVEYVLCNSLGSFEGTIDHIDKSVWNITGIAPDQIDTLIAKAEEEAGKTDIVLSVDTDHRRPVRRGTEDHSLLQSI